MLFDLRDAGTGAPPATAISDLEGRFRFDRVRAGSLQVSLVAKRTLDTVNELDARVTVTNGATATVTLQPHGECSLSGRIVGELDSLGDVRVQLHWLGPPGSTGAVERSAEDGISGDRGAFVDGDRFSFDTLPAGRFQVAASGRGRGGPSWYYGQQEVVVSAGAPADVSVRLEKH